MLIIPELKIVLILVPRAGSTSLKEAVLHKYPEAMLLYRHMEADSIPSGYDRWTRIGVVRNPVDRLWSLYKHLQQIKYPSYPEWEKRQRSSVSGLTFSDWVVKNTTVFTDPYEGDDYYPRFNVNHYLPENKKSQFLYIRPDLGTEYYLFEDLNYMAQQRLGIRLDVHNASNRHDEMPHLDEVALKHIEKYFSWEANLYAS
jgi:hypothetical protein